MDSSNTQNFPADVVSFNFDIGRLAWSARELRRTNKQAHLTPIKTITERLLFRIGAIEVQVHTFTDSQSGLDIVHLLQSCTCSGSRLLVYLQKIITDAQTARPRGPSTRPNFEWCHVNKLISELRQLDKSLRDASDSWNSGAGRSPNGDTQHYAITPKTDWIMSSSDFGSSTSTSNEPTSNQINNSPSEDFPAQPSGDWIADPSVEAICWSEAHHHLDVQQDAYQKALGTLMFDQGHLTTRIYQLKNEWTRLFCQQTLPALVLLFIMDPLGAKLRTPVTFRLVSYQPSLYRLENYLKVYCGGLLQVDTDKAQNPNARRYPFANSVEYEVECLRVRDTTETIAEMFASPDMRNRIQESTDLQNYDALESLANTCVMVLKSTDPSRDSIFHRYLMYLAHILRNATHFSPNKIGFYLNRVGDIMQQCRSASASASPSSSQQRPAQSVRSLYHLTPLAHYRPNDSLHLKPEMRSHADVYTFAAEEALSHRYTEQHVSDPIHGFAITAHALCSWMYRSSPDQNLQVFVPTLQQRKTTLRHLLAHLVPRESAFSDGIYSLWWEIMRNYNKGTILDPMDLVAVFLGASMRPDLLWAQTLRPMVETSMGCRLATLKEALEKEMQYVVAPEYFQYCLDEVMQHLCTRSV